VVEDLEGLGIKAVVPGSSNRLAVVTDAGDGFIFDTRSMDPLLVDLSPKQDDTVRLVALGSNFDVIVTDSDVLVRGNNDFGQLGCGEHLASDDFLSLEIHLDGIAVPPARIASIHCARWSCIMMIDA